MKRTILEAEQALGDLLPTLSDYNAKTAQQAMAAEQTRAKDYASEFVQAREQEVLGVRKEILEELTTLRDAYDELASEGAMGRISATEYAERLNELTARQAQADGQLAMLGTTADSMEQIEEDPISWFADQQQRHPHLMSELGW